MLPLKSTGHSGSALEPSSHLEAITSSRTTVKGNEILAARIRSEDVLFRPSFLLNTDLFLNSFNWVRRLLHFHCSPQIRTQRQKTKEKFCKPNITLN